MMIRTIAFFSKCEDCDLTFKANNLLANILEILNHKASNCSNKKECLPKISYDCKNVALQAKIYMNLIII